MKMCEIMSTIAALAAVQGFYSLLYAELMDIRESDPEWFDDIRETLEAQHFKNAGELVLFIEA